MTDQMGREISYLRLSVTDRCNLRCTYCMPETGVPWTAHSEILTYEELLRLARLFARLGVRRVRITGGEPLVRRGPELLIAGLKAISGIEWVGLTTNGVLLREQLPALVQAGIDGVNLSLDTLDREQYQAITRRDCLPAALEGLAAARAAPHLRVKINCVPTEFNRSQWAALAALAQDKPALDVRFIELMPIGLGSGQAVQTEECVRTELERVFGPARPCPTNPEGGPAHYVTFDGLAGRIGFISAVSHPFCGGCNRIRLTSQGLLKPCLQYGTAIDLRASLRNGASDEALLAQICQGILQKPACHHFSSVSEPEDERRSMNQIGG